MATKLGVVNLILSSKLLSEVKTSYQINLTYENVESTFESTKAPNLKTFCNLEPLSNTSQSHQPKFYQSIQD